MGIKQTTRVNKTKPKFWKDCCDEVMKSPDMWQMMAQGDDTADMDSDLKNESILDLVGKSMGKLPIDEKWTKIKVPR